MSLAWRLALRDLRGGLLGLRLLILCLFLGVAALAGVGSLSGAIIGGLESRGQDLLGGDLQLRVSQRFATPEERQMFARAGRVSETVRMRAMASRVDGRDSVLSELKGVDDAYPLYGALRLEPGALAGRPRGTGVVVAPALVERLGVRVGDGIRVGDARLRVIGIIAEEPDRLSEGFTLGPVILADRAGIAATRLIQPGSLYDVRYRLRLPEGADPAAIGAAVVKGFPAGGWQPLTRANSAPTTRRFVDYLGQFLGLVGLTALAVAGIGVGNGVSAWLDRRQGAIATLKVLGATARIIVAIHLLEIAAAAAIGIVAGVLVGVATPAIVGLVAGDALPVSPQLGVYPAPLLLAAAYGVLIALLFSLVPLARAQGVTAASLFRSRVEAPRPSRRVLALVAAVGGLIVLLAIASAVEPQQAALFVAAVLALLLVLALLGRAVRAIAAWLPRPRRPLARLALTNLHRPGAQTDRLVVALGLGMTLFATLATIQTNLSGQIESTVPERAPSFFALDIPNEDIDRFRQLVTRAAPTAQLVTVPSLRGPVVAIGDTRVSDMRTIPDGAWILRGDRGLTYAAALPPGSSVVAGRWWPKDYAGPPLISLDARAADALGLKVGDRMTVSVLGVEVEARISSLRAIKWDTMGLNFAIIFSPGTLEGAPHSYLATIAVPAAAEPLLNRQVAKTFPSVSLIRVKDVIGQVSALLGQLSTAVQAAASVAVLAGIAVLIGAIAASRSARLYDAVLLKLLGATRAQVLALQAIEYAVLGAGVALLALAIGAGAGWYVVVRLFALEWQPDWLVIVGTVAAGAVLTLAVGLIGALPALSARPARMLRTL